MAEEVIEPIDHLLDEPSFALCDLLLSQVVLKLDLLETVALCVVEVVAALASDRLVVVSVGSVALRLVHCWTLELAHLRLRYLRVHDRQVAELGVQRLAELHGGRCGRGATCAREASWLAYELGLATVVEVRLVALGSRSCVQLFVLLLTREVVVLLGLFGALLHQLHLLLGFELLSSFELLCWRHLSLLWLFIRLLLGRCLAYNGHILDVHLRLAPLHAGLLHEQRCLFSNQLHFEDLANRWPLSRILLEEAIDQLAQALAVSFCDRFVLLLYDLVD